MEATILSVQCTVPLDGHASEAAVDIMKIERLTGNRPRPIVKNVVILYHDIKGINTLCSYMHNALTCGINPLNS